MTRHVVIGTAGHIDHGKTALVRALTGVDTDRLAEEKRRGITIDLGFAHMTLPDGTSASVVDVPGHEDFIRNMVAGASGIDVALLVIAADEGVMPQTREHLAILRMLGVGRAVVALTKSDLADPDWLALVEEDVRGRLRDTSFAHAAILPVSARTGFGIDELRAALAGAVATPVERPALDLFRLPVDRAFTSHGTGTVVTGTVRDGVVAVGDELLVLPAGVTGRVRGVQRHGEALEHASAGSRAALALAGVDLESVGRGSWVVSRDWPLTPVLTVRLDTLPDAARPIRRRQRVRVHLGTAEVMARVVLLEGEELAPGDARFVQLRLEAPVVARAGDRFVVRSYSPVTTIGGGVVLEPMPARRRALTDEQRLLLRTLEQDPAAAVPLLVEAAGWHGLPASSLPLRCGLAHGALPDPLPGVLVLAGRLLSSRLIDEAGRALTAAVGKYHRSAPLRPGLELAAARRVLPAAEPAVADFVIETEVAAGRLERVDGALAIPGFRATVDSGQGVARDALERVFREADVAPPRLDELPAPLRDRGDLRELLRLLEREGVLRPLAADRLIHRDALAGAERRLAAALAGRSGLGPAEFRSVFDLPRRHLIPLLEAFDRLGWTRREGDTRRVTLPVPPADTASPQKGPGIRQSVP